MKAESRILHLAVLSFAFRGALLAQPFLYHADQDKNAQLAASTAKEIANGAIFNKEIQNLDALSKIEIQSIFSFAQVQFQAGIGAFTTWKAVANQLDRIEPQLQRTGVILTPEEAQARISEVAEQMKTIRATIDKISQASAGGTDLVKEIQGHLKTADDALAFAKALPTGNEKFSAAIETVKKGLDTASILYDTFATAFEARKTTQDALAKLNTPPEVEALQLLRLELQHLQWIAQNSARRDLEAGVVIELIDGARNKLRSAGLLDSTEKIETTLEQLANTARSDTDESRRVAARGRLFLLLIALHEATAARAQADLPVKLAELRDTQEDARYSIVRSGSRVSSSETLIQSAVARLALYYQGGIKPAQLAQLLYNLSGLVSLPIIATK